MRSRKVCNPQLFILHNLHGGWQPTSPFAAPQAWCLINAQGGNVWDGASHQQCRATASLCLRPHSLVQVPPEAPPHVPAHRGSPSPHPLGANPEDLALVWYNPPLCAEGALFILTTTWRNSGQFPAALWPCGAAELFSPPIIMFSSLAITH